MVFINIVVTMIFGGDFWYNCFPVDNKVILYFCCGDIGFLGDCNYIVVGVSGGLVGGRIWISFWVGLRAISRVV